VNPMGSPSLKVSVPVHRSERELPPNHLKNADGMQNRPAVVRTTPQQNPLQFLDLGSVAPAFAGQMALAKLT